MVVPFLFVWITASQMMISGSISERVFLILPTAVVPPFEYFCFGKN